MFIKPCPKCGRNPKIEDIVRRDIRRRRICSCPKLCSVIPSKYNWVTFEFCYNGDGDDNRILKQWNNAIEMYEKEEGKDFWDKHYSEDWITDKNVSTSLYY